MDANELDVSAARDATQFAAQELSVAQADERSARQTLTTADDRIGREERQLAEIDNSKSEALQRRDRAQVTLTAKDAQVAELR